MWFVPPALAAGPMEERFQLPKSRRWTIAPVVGADKAQNRPEAFGLVESRT